MNSTLVDAASNVPAVSTPPDPASIPISAPHGESPPPQGQLLPDVKLSEEIVPDSVERVAVVDPLPPVSSLPILDHDGDTKMEDVHDAGLRTPDTHASEPSPAESSTHPRDNDADEEPPQKRARKLSDADQASLVHSPMTPSVPETNGVQHAMPTPPPTTPQPTPPAPITFSPAQHKFAVSTVRSLKKQKDAPNFIRPVDYVLLNIPHYPNVIKHPMDLGTIEKKLNASNPLKPEPNPPYRSADEWIADVRLIFTNCLTFNGPDHAVTQQGKRLEAVFDKQIKQLPLAAELPKPAPPKPAPPPPPPREPTPPPPPPVKKAPARRPSTSVPAIRRSDTEVSGRPKREIHPPPPKDLPYADAPRKPRRGKEKRDDGTQEQLKFCGKILADFLKQKKYWPTVAPFVEPVDYVTLNIPSYPKIIKRPMDLGTMKVKLERNEYPNASKFWDDFKLIIKNCFTFNPKTSPVYEAAVQMQEWFDEKWYNLPPLKDVSDDDESEEETDDESSAAIAMMENQLNNLRNGIDAMKKKKHKKTKDRTHPSAATAHRNGKSSSSAHQHKMSNGKKKKTKTLLDEEVLTFEQKKDLSETIQTLDGSKLERVIQIIHAGVPEIRDSNEEIELDIDSLPAGVLTKLYNFVIRPLQPSKRQRSKNPGGGTGGLKRKSMDEDYESEKIRMLEQKLERFNNPDAPGYGADDMSQSSDSSDDSGSSDSDSD